MKKYEVTRRYYACHFVEANSAEEAEAISDDTDVRHMLRLAEVEVEEITL